MVAATPNDARRAIIQAFWLGGMNSSVDPLALPATQYQQAFNVVNHGGTIQTRPRLRRTFEWDSGAGYLAPRGQGLTWFQPSGADLPFLVAAVGGIIYCAAYPYADFTPVQGMAFSPHARQVHFTVAVQNVKQRGDGSLKIVKPRVLLMVADGESRVGVWNGITNARTLDPAAPSFGPPIANFLLFSNQRLAVAEGPRLHLSDLADPTKFTEERVLSGGGTLTFPGNITALGEMPDRSALLVFTAGETYSIQTSIFDRQQWQGTPGFQRRLFANVGCVSQKSFVNQLGVSWWYSAGGLVGLDAALNSNRSSSLAYQDQAMKRSRDYLHPDRRGVCCGLHDNFLLCSVPHADKFNRHTWVLDDDAGNGRAWAGIWTGPRPVQWASANINGRTRTFMLSENVPGGAAAFECFTQAPADDENSIVPCAVETSVFMGPLELSRFVFAELEFTGLVGEVTVSVSFAGRTGGGYRQLGEPQILKAPPGPTPPPEGFLADTPVATSRPQNRTLRTVSFDPAAFASLPAHCAETPRTAPVGADKGFSLYIRWDGIAGLRRVTVHLDREAESAEGTTARVESSAPNLTVDDTALEPVYQLYAVV